MKAAKILLPVAQYSCVAGFIFTSYQADRVLSKAGIGNLEVFAFWSRCSWLAITVFLLLWMVATVMAVVNRQGSHFSSGGAYVKSILPDVILPPVILLASWLAYMFLS
jgi:hypothetical protein